MTSTGETVEKVPKQILGGDAEKNDFTECATINDLTMTKGRERPPPFRIEGFRFHDLRHTFASRLAQMGTDPYAIQRLMGHKTFTTTQGYAHHYSDSLKKAMEALDTFRSERLKLKLAQN